MRLRMDINLGKSIESKIRGTVILITIAIFSIFIIGGLFITQDRYHGQVEIINRNIETVLSLTEASTISSAAVTMIPGDTATPIAEKLADFSTYFIAVLSVLYLEKFLIVLSGKLAAIVFIPSACAFQILSIWIKKDIIKSVANNIAVKVLILGIAIGLVIPVSVFASNAVYLEFQTTIDEAVTSANTVSSDIQGSVEESEEEDSGFLSGITNTISTKFSLAIDGAKKLINSFVESLAIMLVVSCLIPILIFILFIWLVKSLLNIQSESLISFNRRL
jgi:hypothetical protein